MKKIYLGFLLALFVSFVANARYVRKLREPDFFIPENDRMHKPEKLPPVKVITPKQNVKKEVFNEVPLYKTKYNKYLADVAVFANSKTMPKNDELDRDLAAMESGEIFEVTTSAPQKITSREQKQFYLVFKQILEN